MKPIEKKAAGFVLCLLSSALFARPGRCTSAFGTLGAVKSTAKALDKKTSGAQGGAGSSGAPSTACTPQQLSQLAALEASMAATLSVSTFPYTFMLESAHRTDRFDYVTSSGPSTAQTLYQSASTSKLVAAVTILSLVDANIGLTLDSKPQDFIPWWQVTSTMAANGVTLRDLMSFTSGLATDPVLFAGDTEITGCLKTLDFENCVHLIYRTNINNNIAPGSQFDYSATHLQIAGLMAVKAVQAVTPAGSTVTWTDIFNTFKNDPSRTVFQNSVYDLPSSTNPRLAGGMHWTSDDYLDFLRKLYKGGLLKPSTRAALWADQRNGDGQTTVVIDSPLLTATGQDWHYALGNWVEGQGTAPFVPVGRNSSPGAYGAYPFIDFQNGYYGILAMQDLNGPGFREGLALYTTIANTATSWGAQTCGN